MFQVPTAESKERRPATRTAPEPEPVRELHPHAHIGASLRGFDSGAARHRQRLAGLQSMIGNQAMLRMLDNSGPVIQTKLAVNRPGDSFEQEADRVADHVMSMTTAPIVQRSCSSPSEHNLQRKCAECEKEESCTASPPVPPPHQPCRRLCTRCCAHRDNLSTPRREATWSPASRLISAVSACTQTPAPRSRHGPSTLWPTQSVETWSSARGSTGLRLAEA